MAAIESLLWLRSNSSQRACSSSTVVASEGVSNCKNLNMSGNLKSSKELLKLSPCSVVGRYEKRGSGDRAHGKVNRARFSTGNSGNFQKSPKSLKRPAFLEETERSTIRQELASLVSKMMFWQVPPLAKGPTGGRGTRRAVTFSRQPRTNV